MPILFTRAAHPLKPETINCVVMNESGAQRLYLADGRISRGCPALIGAILPRNHGLMGVILTGTTTDDTGLKETHAWINPTNIDTLTAFDDGMAYITFPSGLEIADACLDHGQIEHIIQSAGLNVSESAPRENGEPGYKMFQPALA